MHGDATTYRLSAKNLDIGQLAAITSNNENILFTRLYNYFVTQYTRKLDKWRIE